MEIKQIKYFVEVVRQGGMTQASEHLYIAQSTISKAIKNIENEYDITLFDRSQKQIKLTDIGQTFYDNSLEFLALFEKLSLEMNDIVNVQKGHIKIGLSPMMNVQRSEEHTSELQSPNCISYAVFCLKKKNKK